MKKLTKEEILKLKNKKIGKLVLRFNGDLYICEDLCLSDSQFQDLKCFLKHFIYHNNDDDTYRSWYLAEDFYDEDD